MGRRPLKGKGGKGGWQSRVGRLLKEDDTARATQVAEATNASHNKRKRDANDTGDSERAEGVVEDSPFDPTAIAQRRKEMYKTESKATQLFVGNLPRDTTQEEVSERFSAFGKVKKVLLVKDKESGHPTGVAFVHFATEQSVTKALTESKAQQDLHEMEYGKNAVHAKPQTKKMMKKLIFKGKSLEHSDAGGIVFNGRTLRVNSVVSRNEAGDLTRKAERDRVKDDLSDPRNLHLLEEGRILANTPAAQGVLEQRLLLLQGRHQVKKKKLKDPNYFVSRTRLCFRDLPPHIDDKSLKHTVSESVRKFTKAHPEYEVSQEQASRGNPYIKMLRVVKDPATTVSRGFAFAEFREHEVALNVLRHMNNNPTLFNNGKRLDVEFAIESVHALQKLQRITDKGRERNQAMRGFAAQGKDPKEAWRMQQEEKVTAKLAEKEKRKKEFEKYKKFQKYSGRKNQA